MVKKILKYLKWNFLLIFYKILYFFQIGRSDIVFFSDKVFKDKKIIIVGPADTALSYMDGSDIDKFDFIIRVNKAPLMLEGLEDKIGSRTDVLYHCFSEDPIDGGGEINFNKLKDQKNKYIVYTYNEPMLDFSFYRTILKYKGMIFYRVKGDFYKEIKRYYPARWPTTGLQAILHLMSSDFKELHITGFTFFRTGYLSGYTDHKINESEQSRKYQIEKNGSHSFDGELDLFRKYYQLNQHKNIYFDKFISDIFC